MKRERRNPHETDSESSSHACTSEKINRKRADLSGGGTGNEKFREDVLNEPGKRSAQQTIAKRTTVADVSKIALHIQKITDSSLKL